jgi:hypothetical protein
VFSNLLPGSDSFVDISCNLLIRCHGNGVFTKLLPSNGLFRVATGMCLARRCLADGLIQAFRRNVALCNYKIYNI